MRIDEITRRGFLKSVGALASLPIIKKVHSEPSLTDKNYNLYDEKIQSQVAKIVAKMYGVEFKDSVPLPKVVPFSSIDPKIYLETWGWIPSTQTAPHYHWVRNIIILSPSSKIDTLAHEYVHYFQFHPSYKNLSQYVPNDRDGFFEYEAKQIQEKFAEQLKS